MAKRLRVGAERSAPITDTTLLLWFEANKDSLAAMHTRSDFDTWLNKHLDRLTDYPGKSAFLKMMGEVSAADGEVHISETALSVLAARRWNLIAA